MTVGMLMMTAGLLVLSRLEVDTSYNMIWPASSLPAQASR